MSTKWLLATILCILIELCSISLMFSTFLLAIAEVYLREGDNEYSRGETNNAVHFYSEGLQVNCKDIKLNAKLYSNRAAAQLLLGTNWSIVLDPFCIHFDRDWLQSFTVRIVCVKENFCCFCMNLNQSDLAQWTAPSPTSHVLADFLFVRRLIEKWDKTWH